MRWKRITPNKELGYGEVTKYGPRPIPLTLYTTTAIINSERGTGPMNQPEPMTAEQEMRIAGQLEVAYEDVERLTDEAENAASLMERRVAKQALKFAKSQVAALSKLATPATRRYWREYYGKDCRDISEV